MKYRSGAAATKSYWRTIEAEYGDVCLCCDRSETAISPTGEIRRLCADHNHETYDVRGVLCQRCNSIIGNIDTHPEQDKAKLIQQILEYIEVYCKT